jgi:hypothetical protein
MFGNLLGGLFGGGGGIGNDPGAIAFTGGGALPVSWQPTGIGDGIGAGAGGGALPAAGARSGGGFGLGTPDNPGILRNLLGGLADGMAQSGGLTPTYGPQMQQRRQDQRQLAMMQAQQQAELQQKMAMARFKRDNPEPTTEQQNFGFVRGLDEAGQAQWNQLYGKGSQAPILREDNAGNVWQMNPANGQWNLSRADSIPKYYIQGDRAVEIANPYAAGAQAGPIAIPGAPVGQLTREDARPSNIPSGNPLDPKPGRR